MAPDPTQRLSPHDRLDAGAPLIRRDHVSIGGWLARHDRARWYM